MSAWLVTPETLADAMGTTISDATTILSRLTPVAPEVPPRREFGPCPTLGTDNPSRRPWHYGHAAGIEGLHWDVYAGEGPDGWLVASVGTEADAALIVESVNRTEPPDATRRVLFECWVHGNRVDPTTPPCADPHPMTERPTAAEMDAVREHSRVADLRVVWTEARAKLLRMADAARDDSTANIAYTAFREAARGLDDLRAALATPEPPDSGDGAARLAESGLRLARIIEEADTENPEWAKGARFVLGWTKGPDDSALEVAFRAVREAVRAAAPAEAREEGPTDGD